MEGVSDMLDLAREQAMKACRALLAEDRAENLIASWQRAYPEIAGDAAEILVIASLIAAGSQEPSAATSLSAAQGLESKAAGRMLLLIGLAHDVHTDCDPMTDTIRQLVGEGLQSTFEKFTRTFAQKENPSA